MHITLVTPPATEPITLDEAKEHLRVDVTDEDDYIEGLIRAARQYAETTFTHRAFIEQELRLTLNRWPVDRYLELPRPPLISVTSITYTDEDGTADTLTAGTDYLVDTAANRLVLRNGVYWPTVTLQESGAISIVYLAGYGDRASDVPEEIRHALKILVGHWYENREPVVIGSIVGNIPMSAEALLWPHRAFNNG